MKDLNVKKLVKFQVDIFKQYNDFEQLIIKNSEPFIDECIPNNKQLSAIIELAQDTITELTSEKFYLWIDWYIYETEFGSNKLNFRVDNIEYEPTFDNIFEHCLDLD